MLMEPEIYNLYLHKELFRHSYFIYLDEYEALYQKYMYLYAGLEETLRLEDFNALIEMLQYQDAMEEFRTMHYFRQGALLQKAALKKRLWKTRERKMFLTFHSFIDILSKPL